MTVPLEPVGIARFIHTSLAIQARPSANPVSTRNSSHAGTPRQNGITSSTRMLKATPPTTERCRPTFAIRRGYAGPRSTIATRLTAMTLPMATVEFPARFSTIAISGGSKPNIRPTPKLVEKTAASTQGVLRSMLCVIRSPCGGIATVRRNHACHAIHLRTS